MKNSSIAYALENMLRGLYEVLDRPGNSESGVFHLMTGAEERYDNTHRYTVRFEKYTDQHGNQWLKFEALCRSNPEFSFRFDCGQHSMFCHHVRMIDIWEVSDEA